MRQSVESCRSREIGIARGMLQDISLFDGEVSPCSGDRSHHAGGVRLHLHTRGNGSYSCFAVDAARRWQCGYLGSDDGCWS
mmetsp:Transcript_981/g.1713  ORF Transcript_981/g.1713 Transcript_981/m.1713 type:complete len:81 (+) Transcript_981:1278-1520(+)